MPQIWETLHPDWCRQEFRILAANFRHTIVARLLKIWVWCLWKPRYPSNIRSGKPSVSLLVWLKGIFTHLWTPNLICAHCSAEADYKLTLPLYPRQLIHLQRNPALTPFPLEKQVLQNTRIHIRRNAWKPPVLHRHMHSTHKPEKKDINIKAQQQKGHSTHTDEGTQQRLVEHKSPLLPHLLFLPALFAKPWLAIKALQRNLLLLTLTQSGFPPLCKS